jgi:hypothetical protein
MQATLGTLPVTGPVSNTETRELFLVMSCLQHTLIGDSIDPPDLDNRIDKIIEDFDQRFLP